MINHELIQTKSRNFQDSVTGLQLVPFSGTRKQIERMIKWDKDNRVGRYLYPPGYKPIAEDQANLFYYLLAQSENVITHEIIAPDTTPIGYIELYNFQPEKETAEIGFAIGELDYWGYGYAGRAVDLMIGVAKELGVKTLLAEAHGDNIGSVFIFRKYAYTVEVHPADPMWLVFSIHLR